MTDVPSLTLTVAEGGDAITLEPSCLLVFVDETGDEAFSDPHHPVFGLGGCAMPVAEYVTLIRPRWLEMKQRFFGGATTPLHASELRSPSQAQIEALCEFFAIDRFTRVVAVASSKTAFPEGHPPYQLIALTLLKRIERAGSRFPLSRLALIVESSSRADALANRYLGPFNVARIAIENEIAETPIHHYFLPKALNEPGLEIADFIMHTVGAQARARLLDSAAPTRKDFAALIQSVPKAAVEYMSIDKVEANAA